ncbi:MAG: phospholipase D-like domain-containing protein [Pseudomonas sp.]
MASAVFPWRGGNRFELLIDGACFFPRMLEAIASAEARVELELYLLEDGACAAALVQALAGAAQRGVRVRCLFDDFGSLGLGRPLRERLVGAGVELRLYNPLGWRRGLRNLFRDHRKLLVVDGRRAFVGGTGATDAFWNPAAAQDSWHEVMVDMAGPLVVDWQALFERQWLAYAGHVWRPRGALGLAQLPPSPPAGLGLGRVAYADAQEHRDIVQGLMRNLRRARQRIWLATPYFLPTWKVRRALLKAARRGVEVRLLLTSRRTDHPPVRFAGQRYYPRLLRAGVRIFEYQPRFLHLKMMLVDDWVSVGSCNFDHWSLRWNLEANIEVLDPQFTSEVAESLLADFAASREITLEDWRAQPLLKRFYQRLWGWLDRAVVNLLDKRR